MPNSRSYTAADYSHRYGFNGMTEDNEMKGEGNSLDFGARFYDPRVGRFLSLDPMMEKFPWQSPYITSSNNPINYIDVNGEWAYCANLPYATFNSRLFGVPVVPYSHADTKDYKMKSTFISMDPKQVKASNIRLNNVANVINNNLKSVADFIRDPNVVIAVGIAQDLNTKESDDDETAFGFMDPNKNETKLVNGVKKKIRVITLDKNTYDNYKDFLITFVHETVHAMDYGEFYAYGSELLVGQYTDNELSQFVSWFNVDKRFDKKKWEYMHSGMPEEFNNKWFDGNGNLTFDPYKDIDKRNEFIQNYKDIVEPVLNKKE